MKSINNRNWTEVLSAWLIIFVLSCGTAVADGTGDFDAVIVSDWIHQTGTGSATYFMGDVGIGTTAPSNDLHVAGGLTVDGAMAIPRQGDIEMGSYTNGVSAGGGSLALLPKGSTGNLIYHDGTAWVVVTNFVFDAANGRVGIGTDSPGGELDLAGGVFVLDDGAGSSYEIVDTGTELVLRTGNDTVGIELNGGSHTVTLPNGELVVQGSGDSSFAGDVGIGVAAPDVRLQVDAGADNQIARFSSTDNIGFVRISDEDAHLAMGVSGTKARINNESDLTSAHIVIDTDGDVGIGTTSVDTKLHVEDVENSAYIKVQSGGSNTYAGVQMANTSRWWVVRAEKGGSFSIRDQTGGATPFFINPGVPKNVLIARSTTFVVNDDGIDYNMRVEGAADIYLLFTDAENDRVGIGTANPSHKLHVDGTAKFEGDIIMAGNSITNLATPVVPDAAATKGYVDALGFEDRGDVAAYDYDASSIHCDGATHKLYVCVSNDVPSNAVAVVLSTWIEDDSMSSRIYFWETGNENGVNTFAMRAAPADAWVPADGIVALGQDGTITYEATSNTIDNILISVKGWFK